MTESLTVEMQKLHSDYANKIWQVVFKLNKMVKYYQFHMSQPDSWVYFYNTGIKYS